MSKSIAWAYDLAEVMDMRDAITKAFQDHLAGSLCYKPLCDARDNLNSLCTVFERNGMAEEFEGEYYQLFDALSHLTESLRGHKVDARHLTQALQCLDRFLTQGGGQ